MNDTIILNGREEETPRGVKRVKRGPSHNGGYTAIRFKEHRFPNKPSKNIPDATLTTVSTKDAAQSIPGADHVNGAILIESQPRNYIKQSSASTVMPSKEPSVPMTASQSTKPIQPRNKLQIKHYAPPGTEGHKIPRKRVKTSAQGTQTSSNSSLPRLHSSELAQDADVNFATAPDGPVEIAWWLAYQISHFDRPDAADLANDAASNDSSGMQNNHASNASRASKLDSGYVKEQARKRQQRWRASNRERKNLNDLRARVNRDAKQRFGADMTEEKEAWIDDEFLKRRTKQEMKQRLVAAQLGKYPEFQVRAEVRKNMTATDSSLDEKVQDIRKLVVELLFPKDGKRTKAYLTRTARSFLSAMEESGAGNNEILKAVCKSIADTSEAMMSIRTGLDEAEGDEVDNAMKVGKESLQTNGAENSAHATASDSNDDAAAQSAQLMKAIDDAVAILARINDVTQPKSSQSNSKRKPQAKGADAAPAGIDLDAFLETANAGPLGSMLIEGEEAEDAEMTDANDDETIDDPIEARDSAPSGKITKKHSDSDIWNTIDHVIDQLVSKRMAYEAKKGGGRRFNAQAQAQQARKLLADADLRMNFAMTRAKSEAISHLYSQLVGLLNSGSQSSENTSAAHSTSHTNKPDASGRPGRPATKKPKRSPGKAKNKTPTPTATPRTLPPLPAKYDLARLTEAHQFGARTEEEQRKIRSYGYPPLPGSKVGTPRHST